MIESSYWLNKYLELAVIFKRYRTLGEEARKSSNHSFLLYEMDRAWNNFVEYDKIGYKNIISPRNLFK